MLGALRVHKQLLEEAISSDLMADELLSDAISSLERFKRTRPLTPDFKQLVP